eukprot:scaffold652624_cov102-Prasinocladus_malaysianus.AAC.1
MACLTLGKSLRKAMRGLWSSTLSIAIRSCACMAIWRTARWRLPMMSREHAMPGRQPLRPPQTDRVHCFWSVVSNR